MDARDLTAAPFAADNAAAVVLADYGKLSFPTGSKFRLDRITRIKICPPRCSSARPTAPTRQPIRHSARWYHPVRRLELKRACLPKTAYAGYLDFRRKINLVDKAQVVLLKTDS